MTAAVSSQRARQAYQTSQVVEQDPMTLVVMLYDGLLGFVERAEGSIEANDRPQASELLRRASDIVGELQAVLDMNAGGEVAVNLDRIYSYCRRRLMDGHINMDAGTVREVRELLKPLRDAWEEARGRQRGLQ
jgi:flagellar protein FliS